MQPCDKPSLIARVFTATKGFSVHEGSQPSHSARAWSCDSYEISIRLFEAEGRSTTERDPIPTIIPTKVGSKMGGEFTYPQKMEPKLF